MTQSARRLSRLLVLASLTVPLAPLAAQPASTPAPSASAVVLELFTSQGCASCPPADALLGKLAEDPEWRGRIVPLGYHVDSWNYVGWTDPFSSADWTDRQTAYARRLTDGSTYTPQAIVNGRSSAVGSDERVIRQQLAAAAAQPQGQVTIALRRDGNKVAVDLVAAAPAGRSGRLDLMLAVVENGLVTDVPRGENAHRTLQDDFVVRRLERAAKLASGSGKASTSVRLDRDWNAEHTSVAAFLQDPDTRAIYGAAVAPVPQTAR